MPCGVPGGSQSGNFHKLAAQVPRDAPRCSTSRIGESFKKRPWHARLHAIPSSSLHAALTQSMNICRYALCCLDKLGLRALFPDDHIFAVEAPRHQKTTPVYSSTECMHMRANGAQDVLPACKPQPEEARLKVGWSYWRSRTSCVGEDHRPSPISCLVR